MNYFDYYQVITLIIFLLVFFGRTIWLRITGTRVFVLGSGKKGFTALLEKSFLIFFPIWLIEIGIHSLHLNIQFLPLVLVMPIFKNQIMQFAGAAVIFVSLLFFCLALISFNSSWRVGIDTVSPGDLIITGVFSVTRNPIFLSMDLYFLGTFLIYSNLFFLMCFVCIFVCIGLGFQFQIRQEETFLLERYGENYRKYMALVNRYI
jgi:protein-S-isoprenylcysteine O-methyltransferase Ste14